MTPYVLTMDELEQGWMERLQQLERRWAQRKKLGFTNTDLEDMAVTDPSVAAYIRKRRARNVPPAGTGTIKR